VSNYGRIKSTVNLYAKILTPIKHYKGYYVVNINKKKYYIHRLVALSFIPNDNPKEKNQVHHKDNNKRNNNAVNL